jgi:hypothetical protein
VPWRILLNRSGRSRFFVASSRSINLRPFQLSNHQARLELSYILRFKLNKSLMIYVSGSSTHVTNIKVFDPSVLAAEDCRTDGLTSPFFVSGTYLHILTSTLTADPSNMSTVSAMRGLRPCYFGEMQLMFERGKPTCAALEWFPSSAEKSSQARATHNFVLARIFKHASIEDRTWFRGRRRETEKTERSKEKRWSRLRGD